jgi:very-short-patch-repair endonuclease
MYTVGQKTAEYLSDLGFPSNTPQDQDATGLARLILQDTLESKLPTDSTILHFCGNKRRDEFRQFLNDSDIEVRDIVVYKTELNNMNLPNKEFHAALFYSPSAVQAFRKSGGFRKDLLPELFAIGPTTAEELSIEAGKHVHISPKPDTEVILRFVVQILGESDVPVPLRRGKAPKGQGDAKYLYYNKDLINLARNLRKNSTKSEIRLWSELLRAKQTGHTFLRQRPVLNYIADFLCKDLKLIIELDGFSHEFEQQWKKDKKRQNELEKAGFKILRFSDDDVMNDLRNVETEILYWIKKLEKNCPPSKELIF